MVDQSDRDQYDLLVSIVDPTQRKGPDEEALLVVSCLVLVFMFGLWAECCSWNLTSYSLISRQL